MAGTPRSPFAGWPRTRQRRDRNGLPVFIVTPNVLTPLRAKIADFLGGASAIALFVGNFSAIPHVPEGSGWTVLALLVLPFAAHPLLKLVWRSFLHKEIRIVLTADRVQVGGLGGKTYDRALPHKFALFRHDETRAEEEKNQLKAMEAQRKGRLILPPRYYSESWHLSFQYLGQVNEIVAIYGHREARAIRDRLTAIDQHLDALTRKGEGAALNPEDQWPADAGDLPPA